MENFQVIHIEKRVTISSGLNRHITRVEYVEVEVSENKTRIEKRVWVPANANPKKTADNVELVSRKIAGPDGKEIELSLQQAVDKRLEEAGIKPRVGQIKSLEMILSGSPEVLNAMNRNALLQWADDSVNWAKRKWGEDNVVSASLHVDEKTPHIHLIVVPIVKGQSRRTKNYHKNKGLKKKEFKTYNIDHDKLRLSADEVYNQKRLYSYHDSYYEEVSSHYGLSRGIKAEPGSRKKHTDSQEYNRKLEREAAQKMALIADLTADYDEKKEQLDAVGLELKTAEEKREQIKKEIDTMKDTKDSLQKDIAESKETIINQTAFKAIVSDALDKQIYEKRKTLSEMDSEFNKRKRLIIDKDTEFKTIEAKVESRRAQLAAKVNLDNVPKKGIMGYKTEEVTAFIESVNCARLLQAMNSAPRDIEVDTDLRDEVDRLRKVEDEHKDFMNSIERLQQRVEYLKTEGKRRSIAEVFKYVLKKAVNILHFTVTQTAAGEDIFAKFTFEGDEKRYAARLAPDEHLIYTDKDLNSLQEVKGSLSEKIWYVFKPLAEIRKDRQKEDTISRLSTKLSLLTGKDVRIIDYVYDGRNAICFSTCSLRFFVNYNHDVWSTADSRVNKLPIPETILNEAIWKKEGNLDNPPKQDRSIKLSH